MKRLWKTHSDIVALQEWVVSGLFLEKNNQSKKNIFLSCFILNSCNVFNTDKIGKFLKEKYVGSSMVGCKKGLQTQ